GFGRRRLGILHQAFRRRRISHGSSNGIRRYELGINRHKKDSSMTKSPCTLLVAAILLVPFLAFAGSDDSKSPQPAPEPWCEEPPRLEIRIGIPGWLAGLSGDTGV